ncbi:MAG: hypothetical protein AAF409_15630 [Pseudomonadota bacterium]
MRALLIMLVAVTALVLPTGPVQAADHKIDPDRDIIVGKLGAAGPKNELIVYLSPGCRSCLKTFGATARKILEGYVAPGHLRVVVRLVPQLHNRLQDPDKEASALQASVNWGVETQCVKDLSGGLDAVVSFVWLAVIYHEMGQADGNPAKTWPLLDQEGFKKYREISQKYKRLKDFDWSYCYSPSSKKEYVNQFLENAEILKSVRSDGRSSVPSYFLNGELIPFSPVPSASMVLEALAEAIPEAE